MGRSRNIKPGFFKNEDLAECSLAARLCFAGLWTIADREGRLEDRPKRIKGELFAYESIEVGPLLCELEAHGFLLRYQNSDGSFIQISKFLAHQTPHYSEKPSTIKPPQLQETDSDDGAVTPGVDAEQTRKVSLIKRGSQPPDSLLSDSLLSDSKKPSPDGLVSGFAEFWEAWPATKRKGGKSVCESVWKTHRLHAHAAVIVAHVKAMAVSDGWTKQRGSFVPAPVVYLRGKRWDGAEVGAESFEDVFAGAR